jgi:Spy/CpxP family protein refolding chaperone
MFILAITLIVLLGWQVNLTHSQRNQMNDLFERQKPAVAQAQQVEAGLTKLVNDMMEAAQTDDTAKQIIAKYVQKNPAAPAASPAAK